MDNDKKEFHIVRRCAALLLDWLVLIGTGLLLSKLGVSDRSTLNVNGILGFVYYTWLTSSKGTTVGKYLLGLRVIAVSGKKLTISRSALRAAPSLIATAALEVGNLVYGVEKMKGGHYYDYPVTSMIGYTVSAVAIFDVLAFLYSKTARSYGGTWHDVLAGSEVKRVSTSPPPQ